MKKTGSQVTIRRSNHKCILDIIDEVKDNHVELVYQILTKERKCLQPSSPTKTEIADGIVAHLYPQQTASTYATYTFPTISPTEVQAAALGFENGKAPVLDGITKL